jgi:hypothetical protein
MTAVSGRIGAPIVALVAIATIAQPAFAVTPDSPEVRKVVDKAFEYLANNTDGRLGGKCLIGLAFLKDGKDETHARVAEAVTACKNATRGQAEQINADIYSTGIAIIFLCSLDPSKYSAEILELSGSLEARQKSGGGWGYPERQNGDTSMTQYGVLAYWEMSKVGFNPSLDSTERVANWLLRTQDPSGCWGYQGKEAEGRVSFDLVKQDSARPGMAAAGLGATYMVADLLGLGEATVQHDETLPVVLRPLRKGQAQQARTRKVDARKVRAAQDRGRDWMRRNGGTETTSFNYYYLYALERYQSFLEAAEGRTVKEPRWYNEGFAFLKKEQLENGSWHETDGLDAVNTAFATLFLLRSTKKAIERSKTYGEGALLVGRGLPGDPQAVRIRGGQIVSKKVDLSVAELLAVLLEPDHPSYAAAVADADYLRTQLQKQTPEERTEHLARLRSLAVSGAGDARVVAVTILGQLRNLDSGPTLIAALDDPDWRVVLAADEALRLIGRSVAPSPLGEKPDAKARAALSQRWKQWYLTIRPDAQFDN